MSRVNHKSKEKKAAKTAIAQVVSVDIETTGLSVGEDEIISIAAVKKLESGENDHFYKLVQIDHEVPKKITELTGISSGMLKEQGVELALVLNGLQEFIKNSVIIGYNLRFDEEFLTYNLKKVNQKPFSNNTVDLMPVVKKADQFLDNYRLGTVLKEYEIENLTPHNALSDAKATLELAEKLMKNGHLKI